MPSRRRPARRPSDGPPKASIYCRVSLDATGEGLAVERQEQKCRELCERNGWEVAAVFVEPAVSAYSGRRRPQFEALLASDPELIVVWHTDRLVRLSTELDRVIELGVNVHAVTAGHVDLSNPAGRAVAKTVVAWAQYESEQKAERQRAAGHQRASKGRSWWGSRPFGFELDGSHRESEADALRAAYAGVLARQPVAQLARELNAAGHVTTFGKPWGPASLRPVLLNARNAGLRIYEGEEIGPANWQGIVSEEIYRAASRILTDPSRGKGGPGPAASSLLTGIAYCGVCGSGVKQNRRYHWKRKDESYAIYVCKSGACASVPADYVEGRVWRELTRVLPDPEFQAAWSGPVPTEETDVAVLKEERRTLTQRLSDAAEDYTVGIYTREQVHTITTRTRTRLQEVEDELARLGSVYDLSRVLGDVQFVYRQIDAMTQDERRALVRAVVDRVTLHPRPRGTKRLTPESVVITLRSAADIRLHR